MWRGGGASTKGCMLSCMCLPSWLGRQLHANGSGDLAGAGLMVDLLVRLARALPGGPARVLQGGPARVLPWRAGVPGKNLAGVLWVSSVRMAVFPSSLDFDYPLSSKRSACHHIGASRALS